MVGGLFAESRYAFIYSKNIDDTFINFYDKVVVEADLVDNIYAIRYPDKMVAYISIGEIEPWRNKNYKKSWIISKNTTWNSLVANLNNREYREFLLKRAEKLYKMGYRNFFLDTLDSYLRIKDKKLKERAKRGAVEFIKSLRAKYPKAKIIVNRGFEILDKIYKYIDAVVAESLIAGYDHSKKRYIDVPKKDREWILYHLNRAKKFGLDIISIDYSNQDTKKREEIAKKIRALGVIPYVTDGLLQDQGECDIKRERRNILILFNKSIFKDKNEVYSDVHRLISMPLEHLGYIPILYDISTKPLPQKIEDRFHSLIVWSSGDINKKEKILEWIKGVIAKNIKVLFLNNFIFEATTLNLKLFGLKSQKNKNPILSKGKLFYHFPFKPYEIRASIEYLDNIITPISKDIKAVLSLRYKNGQTHTPIAITPWGGFAYQDSFHLHIGNRALWTIDPFEFLKRALRLNLKLIPDPTTEGGRRELFVHVDGDGFIEKFRANPQKLAPEILIEEIFKKYKIPQSVSIIEGEIREVGLTKRVERILKTLYAIPWIEPASHTLSHPFVWCKVTPPKNSSQKNTKKFRLDIPNYQKFSLSKETIESINFSLSFAPKYKRDKRVLFWSGDCIPPKSALEYVEKNRILAINGGDTTITKENPFLSFIAPFGIRRGEYWQIYATQQNENIYTNGWRGPFWGYKRAIETFKLTETPRRLKPINIYYHLYSGSKVASLRALDDVYRWALSQKTTKIYTSDYILKAKDFYHTSIGKIGKSLYEIRNSGNLRNLRVDKRVFVDLKNSIGVAGFVHTNNKTYITLDRRKKHIVKLTSSTPKIPYLIDLDGWVEEYQNSKFKLKSNTSIKALFYTPNRCSLKPQKGLKIEKLSKNRLHIYSNTTGATIEFECK